LRGGVRVNGTKYFVTNFDADKNVMYLKSGIGGAAVGKSLTGLAFASFNKNLNLTESKGEEVSTVPQNAGVLNLGVEKLQEFLVTNNL